MLLSSSKDRRESLSPWLVTFNEFQKLSRSVLAVNTPFLADPSRCSKINAQTERRTRADINYSRKTAQAFFNFSVQLGFFVGRKLMVIYNDALFVSLASVVRGNSRSPSPFRPSRGRLKFFFPLFEHARTDARKYPMNTRRRTRRRIVGEFFFSQ